MHFRWIFCWLEDKRIYSHLNALAMNSFSIPFEDSINAQALEHEKMYTPKWSLTTSSRSYKPSWQPITRTSRGVRTTAVATRPGSSNADSRTKRTTPATRARTQRWTPPAAGRLLQLLHRPPALSGRRGHGLLRRRLLRLMLIKLLYLNLNGRDTRQQPVPAYRPASRANQKAAAKRMIYQCTYPVQQCLYISWNVCSRLYTEHKLHSTWYTGLYIECTCLHDSKLVYNSMNMYIHVWTMYIHVYTSECTYHVRTMYIHVYTFQDMSVPCMYMFVFFNNGMYYVCQLTYDSTVHSLYVHGTDMYVHVYARWLGFQMETHVTLVPCMPDEEGGV